ncbi:hypothetical protein L208DRAFT_1347825, partial [Tricholoma matsutake]
FTSEAQLRNSFTASLDDNSASIQGTQMKVCELLNSISDSVGIIANNIKCILESHLLLMFRSVACLGLQQWAPDVLGNNPESMYNLLYEHIALKTFEQVSGAFGYSHMGMNLLCVNDFALMHKLYRSFVFLYMHGIAKSEAKNPGSLADGRMDVFRAHGFNKHIVALARENEAHSDDELAEGNAESVDVVYHIKEKEGCLTKLSELTALPKKVPIDWFDPIYWNNLSLRECAQYVKNGTYVALPPAELCASWDECEKWKSMPEKEFMAKYGDEVQAEYKLPMPDELE